MHSVLPRAGNSFKDQKLTNMLLGGDGTTCFAKKRPVETLKKVTLLYF